MMSERNERDLIGAINRIADALYALGNGNACTGGVGAIEHLAMMVEKSGEALATAISSLEVGHE